MKFSELMRTLRISNLFIIFATQLLCWFFLIRPLHNFTTEILFLDFGHILLLSFATVLLAGAGYIINDYFDVKIDAINRPEKSLIGKEINPKSAIIAHTVCNILGLLIFAYLSYEIQRISALIIPVICTLLLWFYSTHFKRQFVVGNVVVSLLTALSLLIIVAFEPAAISLLPYPYLKDFSGISRLNPIWILVVYSGFAFLLNWIREIIKDLEDFKGDAEDGCVTMPIKIGIGKTVNFVRLLMAKTVLSLVIISILLILKQWIWPAIYLILALAIPLSISFLKIKNSVLSSHFAYYSKVLKWLMIAGVLTLVLFYILQYSN